MCCCMVVQNAVTSAKLQHDLALFTKEYLGLGFVFFFEGESVVCLFCLLCYVRGVFC